MQRIATVTVALVVALTGLGALRPAAARAAAPLELGDAVTDNYKAIWNANPEIRENRTWLQMRSVTADGVTYRPASLPMPGNPAYTTDAALTGSDGSTAVLRVVAGSDVRNKPFRTESTGQWGPLVVLADTSTLQANPVRITLNLERNGSVLASTIVEYSYEAEIYNAAPDNREYNSPGGRFWIGCTPTPLDWQDTTPPSSCGPAQVNTDVTAPVTATIGDQVRADVTVTNAGGTAADSLRVVTSIEGDLELISFSGSAGLACTEDTLITCIIGRLEAGQRVTVHLILFAGNASTTTITAMTAEPGNVLSRDAADITAQGQSCTVTGTEGADQLRGTEGDDVICGLGGNDLLIGFGGNDILQCGAGNDVLQGGAGDDTIDGGTGRDRASYRDALAGVVINMGQMPHPAWDGPATADAAIGWDTVTGVEAATGSPFADTVQGGSGNDSLEGLGGRDRMYGFAGNDRLVGGPGADAIFGGSGTDLLNGQAHTDLCDGGGQSTDTTVRCER
jgi:Ca2+-binding RTX toxin-like protein